MTSGDRLGGRGAQFDQLAARWWDPDGPMKPLHRMNPARVGWIDEPDLPLPARRASTRRRLRRRPRRRGSGPARPRCARGSTPPGEAIEAARAHAEGRPALAYRACLAEDLVAEGRFPVITALEVIEHVPDPAGFVRVLGEPAGAGRAAGAVHPEPHPPVLAGGQGWRRICAADAAGRARMTGKRSSPRPNWRRSAAAGLRVAARPACCPTADRPVAYQARWPVNYMMAAER